VSNRICRIFVNVDKKLYNSKKKKKRKKNKSEEQLQSRYYQVITGCLIMHTAIAVLPVVVVGRYQKILFLISSYSVFDPEEMVQNVKQLYQLNLVTTTGCAGT